MARRCQTQSACRAHRCTSQSACMAHRCKSPSAYMAQRSGSQSACTAHRCERQSACMAFRCASRSACMAHMAPGVIFAHSPQQRLASRCWWLVPPPNRTDRKKNFVRNFSSGCSPGCGTYFRNQAVEQSSSVTVSWAQAPTACLSTCAVRPIHCMPTPQQLHPMNGLRSCPTDFCLIGCRPEQLSQTQGAKDDVWKWTCVKKVFLRVGTELVAT